MKQSDLEAIERIIIRLVELKIITDNNEEQFFFNNLEMNILIEYIEEISINLKKIGTNIKRKYPLVKWDIIDREKYEDVVFGSSMKIGKVYGLAHGLYDALYSDILTILIQNIDKYNHDLCQKRHDELKERKEWS